MSLKEKVSKLEHPIVMAFGNPLLDVFITNGGDDLLGKYNLEVNGQTELARKEMEQLLCDLPLKSKATTSAGGCALNTMRILQQLCGQKNGPQMCVYYGGLGDGGKDDARADTLKELVQAANVDARFAIHRSLPTGICVSIITNTYCRSLAANLGAAGVYTLADLNRTDLPLDSVRIIYIEGFFTTHSFDVAKEVVKRAQGNNIIIAFNLNGTYIFKEHSNEICEMVGLANIIFGNAEEMIALAKSLDLQYSDPADIPFILNNLKGVTVNASNSCSNDWLISNSIIVMTRGGSNPATVVWGQGNHANCNPIEIAARAVKDTTGAGDALVSGFLAGLITGQDPPTCLKWGCKVAAQVVRNIGATLLAADDDDDDADDDDYYLPDDFLK